MKMKHQFTILAMAMLLLVTASIGFGQCSDTAKLRQQFHQFSSAQQAKIWRNHYRFALKTEENLSQEQKDLLTEAIVFTKDDSYSAVSDKSAFTSISERAAKLFSKEQLKRIFYTLTAEEMKGFSLVQAAYYSRLEGGSDCSCNISDNILCDRCISRIVQSCEVTGWGCGFGWVLPCNGTCQYNENQ